VVASGNDTLFLEAERQMQAWALSLDGGMEGAGEVGTTKTTATVKVMSHIQPTV
jgi:hypothetical protein